MVRLCQQDRETLFVVNIVNMVCLNEAGVYFVAEKNIFFNFL